MAKVNSSVAGFKLADEVAAVVANVKASDSEGWVPTREQAQAPVEWLDTEIRARKNGTEDVVLKFRSLGTVHKMWASRAKALFTTLVDEGKAHGDLLQGEVPNMVLRDDIKIGYEKTDDPVYKFRPVMSMR